MTDLVVPWTPNPDTVAVKTNTANEAIAAGKYAICKVWCKGDGKFYIDDVLAFEGYTVQAFTASAIELTNGDSITTGGTANGNPAFVFSAQNMAVTETFRVPTGTDLKVAGTVGNARYVIETFTEIT